MVMLVSFVTKFPNIVGHFCSASKGWNVAEVWEWLGRLFINFQWPSHGFYYLFLLPDGLHCVLFSLLLTCWNTRCSLNRSHTPLATNLGRTNYCNCHKHAMESKYRPLVKKENHKYPSSFILSLGKWSSIPFFTIDITGLTFPPKAKRQL